MAEAAARTGNRKIFYGWYIVGAGFFANVASSFALASTLSIFLKPLTADLAVSRGVFSLLRSGEMAQRSPVFSPKQVASSPLNRPLNISTREPCIAEKITDRTSNVQPFSSPPSPRRGS